MFVDFTHLSGRDAYHLISEIIVPRPIAWVSTISPEGITNLAPFSFFQGVTSCPPTLLFIPVNDRQGHQKDTVRNIEAVPEFVVNLPTPQLSELLDKTAERLSYGISEFETFGIATLSSTRVRPPRVQLSPISLECALDRIVTIGEGPLAANVIFGRILSAHLDDTLFSIAGDIYTLAFNPLARVGSHYAQVEPC